MKFLVLLMALMSFNGFADSSATCDIVNGHFENSSASLTDLKFSTVADIFSMTNAKTLSMNLDGEPVRFLRKSMKLASKPQIFFFDSGGIKATRAVTMTLDKTPRDIAKSKQFYGSMIISGPVENFANITNNEMLIYSFFCRI
jgi:hypothetical protein